MCTNQIYLCVEKIDKDVVAIEATENDGSCTFGGGGESGELSTSIINNKLFTYTTMFFLKKKKKVLKTF